MYLLVSYIVGENDWSWRIRYGAIHSLVKICRCLTNDKAKEGLRNVAWATLIHAHSKEKDDRVLEALKVGEVSLKLDFPLISILKQMNSLCHLHRPTFQPSEHRGMFDIQSICHSEVSPNLHLTDRYCSWRSKCSFYKYFPPKGRQANILFSV